MAFKFTYTAEADSEFDKSHIEFTIDQYDLTIPQILVEFTKFLRAAGYPVDKIKEVDLNGPL